MATTNQKLRAVLQGKTFNENPTRHTFPEKVEGQCK